MFKLNDCVVAFGFYVTYSDMVGDIDKVTGSCTGRIVTTNCTQGLGDTYTVRYGHNREDVVYVRYYDMALVESPDIIKEIDDKIKGKLTVTPDQLREAFAIALGVKDATGWKIGEAIINTLYGRQS